MSFTFCYRGDKLVAGHSLKQVLDANVSEQKNTERAPAWRRRKEQRGPEILAAAQSVFEEFGYEGASVIEIAKRADVSEATIYKYFKNKRALLFEVIRQWMEPTVVAIERDVVAISGLRNQLRFLIAHHLMAMEQSPRLHRVVYSEVRPHDDYYGSTLHKLNQRYTRIATSVIEDGMAAGEVRADVSPSLVRDMIFGGVEHIGWGAVFGGGTVAIDEAADAFAETIFNGIRVVDPAHIGPAEQRLAHLVDRLEAGLAGSGANAGNQSKRDEPS